MKRKLPHEIRGAFMTRNASNALPAARGARSESQIQSRLKEMRQRSDLRRSSEVGGVDLETRTVDLAFSSEIEVRRWFGIEILDHSPGAMRMDRLQNGAALLWNHNWDAQIGVVETARIEGDRKGRAKVRFSRNALSEEKLQDVNDRIVRHVSVGYRIHDARLVEVREDDTEVWLITDWEPYEISLVSVPADRTVGIGRSAENPQEETRLGPIENDAVRNGATDATEDHATESTQRMNEKVTRDAHGNLVRAKVDEDGKIIEVIEILEKAGEAERSHQRRGSEAERARTASILELGERFNATDLAREFVRDGKSVDEFQRALLDRVHQRAQRPLSEQNRAAEIGMSDAEIRRYSLMRAIRALLPNASRADIEAAAFERECSRAAAERYEKEPRGILVPADVLGRAFNAGGAEDSPAGAQSGQNLVATQLLSGSFIDMLRNRTTILRLGTVMGGLVGNLDIPKQTGGATGYWVGEGGNATEGSPAIGQIGLSPKSVAAYTDITRRLLKQSTPDAEGIVRRDLQNALAQTIDLAGYYGTGEGNEPRGLRNYDGINAVPFAVSGKPTFAELVQMESEVAADNADIDQMGYVLNARMRGYCKTKLKFPGVAAGTIWEQGNTINGYRAEVTNQIANGDVFFGNFADLVIGLWGGLDLTVDPFSLSKSGGLRIVVFQDVDFVLRREESVCYGAYSSESSGGGGGDGGEGEGEGGEGAGEGEGEGEGEAT